MTDNIIIHEYIQNQKKLLELELRSEEEEHKNINETKKQLSSTRSNSNDDTSSSSRILRNLDIEDWGVGLMGRTVITLCSKSNSNDNKIGIDKTTGGSKNKNNFSLLPAHRITVGDEVEILSKSGSGSISTEDDRHANKKNTKRRIGGVVSVVTDSIISIVLKNNIQESISSSSASSTTAATNKRDGDQNDEDDSQFLIPPLTIVPKSSIEVHRKYIKVLDVVEKWGANHKFAGGILQSIFDPNIVKLHSKRNSNNSNNNNNDCRGCSDEIKDNKNWFTPFNPNLDESQIEAIQFCLNGNQPISLIHGPPGTGKTTTVAELIHQAVHIHKLKVLVTAPSNVAVDNILERLVSINNKNNTDIISNSSRRKRSGNHGNKIKAVRLGHPARIQPSIINYSLEALVQNSDGTEIVSDIKSEMKSLLQTLSNPKSKGVEKRVAYREMKQLRKEIRQREDKVVSSLINNAQVVLATNVGASSYILDKYEKISTNRPFDLVIIDEAAQALEVSCWIPILRGKRVVLAGDHCQLPPTIKSSNIEVQKGLSKTLFERIMEYGNEVSRMLQVQYRMHEDIADWSSNAMYQGKLLSHDSVKARKLCHLPHVTLSDEMCRDESDSLLALTRNATFLLIDTAGCDMFEGVNSAGSRYNEGEVSLVNQHVKRLIQIGIKQQEIAIITPYNGQVELLKNALLPYFPKLEIRSVDGFQGGEREAVVLSLVRSSDRGGSNGIGFLRDKRRLNVAITRAKRQCAVICDSETVSQNTFLKGLICCMEEKGEYLSAMEYSGETQGPKTHLDLPGFECVLPHVSTKPEVEKEARSSITIHEISIENVIDPSLDSRREGIINDETVYPKDQIENKEEIEQRLSFFTDIAENGEEIEIDVLESDRSHAISLCYELGLLCTREKAKCATLTLTFMKVDIDSLEQPFAIASGSKQDFHNHINFPKDSKATEDNQNEESIYPLLKVESEYLNVEGNILETAEVINEEITHIHDILSTKDEIRKEEFSNVNDETMSSTTEDTTNLTSPQQKTETTIKLAKDAQIQEDAPQTKEIVHSFPSEEGVNISPSRKEIGSTTPVNIAEEGRSMNSLLGSLAKERHARAQKVTKGNKGDEKKPKSSSKRAGKVKPKAKGKKDNNDDDLDDMDFLDSQIEKVQNSHGRTIEASGSNYRTIVNGILIAKPKQVEKKQDGRAASALHNKIKQKQANRKAKQKKK